MAFADKLMTRGAVVLYILALVDTKRDQTAASPKAHKAQDPAGEIGGHSWNVPGCRHALYAAPLAHVILGNFTPFLVGNDDRWALLIAMDRGDRWWWVAGLLG